jgi:energy-coupling factor transporter transmembrane protein EcfT
LHPSCALIVWLAAVLGVQFVGYAGLALVVAGALMLKPAAASRWLGYIRRARWLLLTLWLILAYNTPGEAFHDLAWAPTYEGMAEANLQAARLLAMLACLAWLFVRLGHDGMVGGLWGMLQPVRAAGVDVERLVVRLSLVLENLQTPPEKGAWKRMLAAEASTVGGREVLHFSLMRWARHDTLLVALSGLGLIGAVLL